VRRTIFTDEHEQFRQTVQAFLEKECVPHIQEWLGAGVVSREGAGSDLKQIKATARRDGDHYVLNGTKTFISNGILADLVIVVARTEPEAGHREMSLLVVEEGMPGFETRTAALRRHDRDHEGDRGSGHGLLSHRLGKDRGCRS
jgi:alkylation response protein AidB-like acyl-CoA dehydrogenase